MDFGKYLNHQKTEDTQAFIIHYPANSGKTAFSKKLAETRSDVHYVDMLDCFLKNPDLEPINKFRFEKFRDFLLNYQVEQSVLIIDNPDFLLNTWRKSDKEALLNWIKIGLRSPGVTKKTIILMIQEDGFLSVAEIANSYGESRVLPLNTFGAI
jgi:hypothetical protein